MFNMSAEIIWAALCTFGHMSKNPPGTGPNKTSLLSLPGAITLAWPLLCDLPDEALHCKDPYTFQV